jgi:hypothetical protein
MTAATRSQAYAAVLRPTPSNIAESNAVYCVEGGRALSNRVCRAPNFGVEGDAVLPPPPSTCGAVGGVDGIDTVHVARCERSALSVRGESAAVPGDADDGVETFELGDAATGIDSLPDDDASARDRARSGDVGGDVDTSARMLCVFGLNSSSISPSYASVHM